MQRRRRETPAQFFAKELTCIMRCANRARVSKQKGRLILQRVLALHGKYISLSCARLRMHKYSVPSEVDIFKRRIKMQCNIQHDTHAGRVSSVHNAENRGVAKGSEEIKSREYANSSRRGRMHSIFHAARILNRFKKKLHAI
jgi:hypothetical protein